MSPRCSSPAPSPRLLVLPRHNQSPQGADLRWDRQIPSPLGGDRCHQAAMATPHPLPICGLAGKPPGRSNQDNPRGEELRLGLLFPKNSFPQHSPCHHPPGVLLTVSPCPGDAGSLWMLPWKGPQEKPSGRLLRVRTRLCPSCTSSSSSSAGRHAQNQRDAPPNPALTCSTPKSCGMRAPSWSREVLVGVPWGDPSPSRGSRHGPGSGRSVSIPAPKVAAASGLNGFDYLIRLWFNGLDNM